MQTGLVEGDLAFRQQQFGHTPEPNWPFFLDFAARHLHGPGRNPIRSSSSLGAQRFGKAGGKPPIELNLLRRLWQSDGMDKGSVIQTLRKHEPELKAAGIVHLRLFGSVARGEASDQSDVDLMADLDRSMRFRWFAWRGWKTSLPTSLASGSTYLLRIR